MVRTSFINYLKENTANAIFHIILIIVTLLCILPLLLVFAVSITDEKTVLMNGYSFLPKKISLYAYQYLFSDAAGVVRGYAISIFTTVVGTILGVLMSALYAYPISRKDLPWRKFFTFFLFFTMLFGGGLVPWYIVYVKLLGLKNTIAVLIIPYLLIPVNVLIMRTFFSTSVPEAVIESAKIDGAGEFKVLFRIVLPLSKPVLAAIGLFMSLMYWNDWWLSLIFITKENMVNLQYLMYKTLMNAEYLSNSNFASSGVGGEQLFKLPSETIRMAMCIVGIGPIIFAYPFFQRYLVKGLTIGAIKG